MGNENWKSAGAHLSLTHGTDGEMEAGGGRDCARRGGHPRCPGSPARIQKTGSLWDSGM